MNYAFTNGKILDGTKDMQVQTGLCILVQDGTITDIVPDTTDLAGYKTIDLQGRYIMPGLINMHVHLAGNGKPQKKQRDNEKLVKKIMRSSLTRAIAYKMVSGFAKDELLSGVTTIRTVGGVADFDTIIRDRAAAGEIIACGMRSLPEQRLVRVSLPPTRASRFRVDTWQVRLRLPLPASRKHLRISNSQRRKRLI